MAELLTFTMYQFIMRANVVMPASVFWVSKLIMISKQRVRCAIFCVDRVLSCMTLEERETWAKGKHTKVFGLSLFLRCSLGGETAFHRGLVVLNFLIE